MTDQQKTCRWCGGIHGVRCPEVAAMEFDADSGIIVRVEFVQAAPAAATKPDPEAAAAARNYKRLGNADAQG